MEIKKLKPLSNAALIISILPLATLIPTLLKINLPAGVRTVWAGANIFFVLMGLILSIICVRKEESRSVVNIVALIVSILWILMMAGIIGLALALNIWG
jgi:hypothetical protein